MREHALHAVCVRLVVLTLFVPGVLSIMASAPSTVHGESESTTPDLQRTVIVGVSGPSSSGKSTLARLLRTIFNPPPPIPAPPAAEHDGRFYCSFILHEDDFYRPDDQ